MVTIADPPTEEEQMFQLAERYFFGIGVEKDAGRAIELYQQAADLGHLDSICSLGYCYANGIGVERDAGRAVELYQQASDQGHLLSINNLGYCYENGTGVEKDTGLAVELFRQAAEHGHLDSIFNLVRWFLPTTVKFRMAPKAAVVHAADSA